MNFSESTLKAMEAAMLSLHKEGKYELTLTEIRRRMTTEGSQYAGTTLAVYLRKAAAEHPSIFTEVGTRGTGKLYANTKFLEETTNPEEANVGRKNNTVVVKAVEATVETPPAELPHVNVYSRDTKEANFLKEYAAVIGMNTADTLPIYHEALELQISAMVRRLDGVAEAQVSYAESRMLMKQQLGEVSKRYDAFADFVKKQTDATGRFKLATDYDNLKRFVEDFYGEYKESHKEVIAMLEKWGGRTNEVAQLGLKFADKLKDGSPASGPTFADGYGQGFEAGIKFAMEKMNTGAGMLIQLS